MPLRFIPGEPGKEWTDKDEDWGDTLPLAEDIIAHKPQYKPYQLCDVIRSTDPLLDALDEVRFQKNLEHLSKHQVPMFSKNKKRR
jgi:hypothetical protein